MVTSTMTATTIHDFDHHDHYDYNERDQELHDFSATIYEMDHDHDRVYDHNRDHDHDHDHGRDH